MFIKKFRVLYLGLFIVACSAFVNSVYIWKTLFWVAGIHYTDVQKRTTDGWIFTGITKTYRNVRCIIDSLDIAPLIYLINYSTKEAFIHAKTISIIVKDPQTVAVKTEPIYVQAFAKKILNVGWLGSYVVPSIQLEAITYINDKQHFFIDNVQWQAGNLVIHQKVPGETAEFDLEVIFKDKTHFTSHISSPTLDLDAYIHAVLKEHLFEVNGTVSILKHPICLSAIFGAHHVEPLKVLITTQNFKIPSQYVHSSPYIHQPSIDLNVHYEHTNLNVDVYSNQFITEALGLTQKNCRLHMQGTADIQALNIDALNIEGPGLVLALKTPFMYQWKEPLTGLDLDLDLSLDLSKQKRILARGLIDGSLQLHISEAHVPVFEVSLNSKDVVINTIPLKSVPIHFYLEWPNLFVNTISLNFEDASFIKGQAAINVENKTIINSELNLQLSELLLAPFLSESLHFESLKGSGAVSGSWEHGLNMLQSQLLFSIDQIDVPLLKPFDITLKAEGYGNTFSDVELALQFQEGLYFFKGCADSTDSHYFIDCDQAFLKYKGDQALVLKHPFRLNIYNSHIYSNDKSGLELSSAYFSNDSSHIECDLNYLNSKIQHIHASIECANDTFLKSFIQIPDFLSPWNAIDIYTCNLDYNAYETIPFLHIKSLFSMTSTQWGTDIHDVSIISSKELLNFYLKSKQDDLEIINIKGYCNAIPKNILSFQDNTCEIEGSIIFPQSVCNYFNDTLGFYVEAFKLNFNLQKNALNFEGLCQGSVSRISFKNLNYGCVIPSLENMSLDIILNNEGLYLNVLEAFINGRPLTLEGIIPLKTLDFKSKSIDLLDIDRATALLNIDAIALADIQTLLPAWIRPTGKVSLRGFLNTSRKFEGILYLDDLYTYTLPAIGGFQNIHATVELNNEHFKIDQFDCLFNQKPIELTGTVTHNLESIKDFKYDLNLKAEDVLLIHLPGVRIKGDLDASLQTDVSKKTTLKSQINFNEGYARIELADLKANSNTVGDDATDFFIDIPQINDWLLDIAIKGEKFLKIRSSVFSSIVSSNLNITGTLQNPIPQGKLSFYQSIIKFPFSNFRSSQFDIVLQGFEPYKPIVNLNANTRLYGYDLKLKATGSALDPLIEYNSSPSLESGQILNMITTGSNPASDNSTSAANKLGNLGLYIGKEFFSDVYGDKNLEERFDVRSGEDFTTTGDETFYIGYKLTDRLILNATYDQYSSFNLDLKWRFYSK